MLEQAAFVFLLSLIFCASGKGELLGPLRGKEKEITTGLLVQAKCVIDVCWSTFWRRISDEIDAGMSRPYGVLATIYVRCKGEEIFISAGA